MAESGMINVYFLYRGVYVLRAVVQRVTGASVTIDGETVAEISGGITVFVGVYEDDCEKDAVWLGNKCASLRIFEDENGRMNVGLPFAGNRALVVSNFTVCGSAKKGNRPDFIRSAAPEKAKVLIALFTETMRKAGVEVKEGVFAADMKVALVNDGPVTIIVNSKE